MTKVSFTTNITAFQGFEDDAVEGSATTKAGISGNWSQAVNENFRCRLVMAETAGGTNNNTAFQWQYNLAGAGWNNITTTSSVVKAVASAYFAEGDDTTQQVGSGTFITDNDGFTEDGLAGGTADFAGNDETETEACLQIVGADVSDGQTVELRALFDGAAPDGTPVLPSITVSQGISGTLAATENTADTASLSGAVLVAGDLAASEESSDTAAFSGTVLVQGDLAGTESTADSAAFSGAVSDGPSGTLAATESAADTAALSGAVLVQGNLAATESAADTAALSGGVAVQGSLAATEADADVAAFSGAVTDPAITGSLAATEAPDVAAFAGGVQVQGSLAATEGETDSAALSGTVADGPQGTLAATETADVAAFSGAVSGGVVVQPPGGGRRWTGPTFPSFRVIQRSGTLAASEAPDTAAFSGMLGRLGALHASEAPDEMRAIGAVSDYHLKRRRAATSALLY